MGFFTRLFGSSTKRYPPSAKSAVGLRPTSGASTQGAAASYRGFHFETNCQYSLIAEEKKIVRGIWYRDRASIGNPARNRMVVALASTSGYKIEDSDYEATIAGGLGGVEALSASSGGGFVLWFASAQNLLGGAGESPSASPKPKGATSGDIQKEFDQLYVAASRIDRESMIRTGQDAGGQRFIRSYIHERLVKKYPNLQPEDLSGLESNFLSNWAPGFRGWERK